MCSSIKQILCVFITLFLGINAYAQNVIKVGYFPNVTHAHALLLKNFAREGNDLFQIPGITIEWQAYNAGPQAMADLLEDKINIAYVGPIPALSAYVQKKGAGIKVLAGAIRGGSALVVSEGKGLKEAQHFQGKRIAIPDIGNTQDISCRNWLMDAGISVNTSQKHNVEIIPTENRKLLELFQSNKIDGAWTVEPWVSRLVVDADGEIIYTEPMDRNIVAVLTTNEKTANKNLPIIRKFVALHKKITRWMNHNSEEAQKRVASEVYQVTGQEIPLKIIQSAWNHMAFISYISSRDFENNFKAMKRVGFFNDVQMEDIKFENILIRRSLLN